MSDSNNERVIELEEENRRLRSALSAVQSKMSQMAADSQRLLIENESLQEKARESHQQMRLMRKSTTWRLGGVFRGARRLGGKAARNLRSLVSRG